MDKKPFLLTSQQWEKYYRNRYGIIIINPSGWSNKNKLIYSFNCEPITEEEFKLRLSNSITRNIHNN